MTARKGTSKKTTSRKSAQSTKAAGIQTGPLPPYGNAIKEAIGGGDLQNMRNTATSTRKHLKDVTAALKKLEAAIAKREK